MKVKFVSRKIFVAGETRLQILAIGVDVAQMWLGPLGAQLAKARSSIVVVFHSSRLPVIVIINAFRGLLYF